MSCTDNTVENPSQGIDDTICSHQSPQSPLLTDNYVHREFINCAPTGVVHPGQQSSVPAGIHGRDVGPLYDSGSVLVSPAASAPDPSCHKSKPGQDHIDYHRSNHSRGCQRSLGLLTSELTHECERPEKEASYHGASNKDSCSEQAQRTEQRDRQRAQDEVSQITTFYTLHRFQPANSESTVKIVNQVLLNATPRILDILKREIERLEAATAEGLGRNEVGTASVPTPTLGTEFQQLHICSS